MEGIPLWAVIFAIVMVLGFVGVPLAMWLRGWASIRRARSWPRTSGRILQSSVYMCEGGTGDDYSRWHGVTLQYEYVVDGVRHEGRAIAHRPPRFTLESGARRLQQRYPVGRTVVVFYDPEVPGTAVLENAVPSHAMWLVMPVVFLAFAVLFVLAPEPNARARWSYGMPVPLSRGERLMKWLREVLDPVPPPATSLPKPTPVPTRLEVK